MRNLTLVYCFCLLASLHVKYVSAHVSNSTENITSNPELIVRMDCCEMLYEITSYTVQSTGDKVERSRCLGQECLTLQVVQLFINHTRSILDSASTFGNTDSVRVTDTHIEITQHVLLKNTQTMLVLALLGRASLPENLRQEHMSLKYDAALDVLSVRDSSCSTDKTIYSTIVLASISLLVFFIACQVVESEKRKQAGTQSLNFVKPGVNFVNTASSTKTAENIKFFRMHVNQ
jgi:hypothetical protein